MGDRLPIIARRRARGRGWKPGVPVHPLPPAEVEVLLGGPPCAWRWTPDTTDTATQLELPLDTPSWLL